MGNIPLLWVGAVVALICGYILLGRVFGLPPEKRGTTRVVLIMLTGFVLFGSGAMVFIIKAIAYYCQ